jgi:hypothetical protein
MHHTTSGGQISGLLRAPDEVSSGPGEPVPRENIIAGKTVSPQIPSATNVLEISDMQEGNWRMSY